LFESIQEDDCFKILFNLIIVERPLLKVNLMAVSPPQLGMAFKFQSGSVAQAMMACRRQFAASFPWPAPHRARNRSTGPDTTETGSSIGAKEYYSCMRISEATGQGFDQMIELGIAFLLSAVIGLEREIRRMSAGLRTYTIVGTTPALFD
jgi:hypothetical protein